MRTMMLVTAALLGLGVGSVYAGEGEGTVPNTWFTELPGVVARAPVQQVPSTVARNQATGAPTAAFVTSSHRSGTWLLQPYQGNG
jgi:hypothetical protein